MVLQAILAEEIQFSTRSPTDSRYILIGFGSNINLRALTRCDIIDIELDRRIALARFRILELVGAVVELCVA